MYACGCSTSDARRWHLTLGARETRGCPISIMGPELGSPRKAAQLFTIFLVPFGIYS